MQLKLARLPDGKKAIIIRTSDAIAFKSCRRKWSWSSHLMGNLGSSNLAPALWFGSAIHYALEDWHGYNVFGSAADAFRAYCIATSKQSVRDLPENTQELYELGGAMMDYYTGPWSKERHVDQTYWRVNPKTGVNEPQVEVNFEIPIPVEDYPMLLAYMREQGADCVLYRGTIDRMAEDAMGRLWVVEYKTAKVAEQLHYQTDPQVTRYAWACSHIYDKPVAGIIYMQFVKKMPEPPRILSSGKISTASNLATSAPLYRDALIRMYGAVEKAPEDIRKYYVDLLSKEDENKDRYILREYIYRNEHMCQMEAQKILLELEDMMNPDLPLYPNPTRECSRMCSFLGACVSFDDGGDWESHLANQYSQRDQAADRLWRNRIPSPEALKAITAQGTPDLESAQVFIQSLDDAARARVERGDDEINFTFNM